MSASAYFSSATFSAYANTGAGNNYIAWGGQGIAAAGVQPTYGGSTRAPIALQNMVFENYAPLVPSTAAAPAANTFQWGMGAGAPNTLAAPANTFFQVTYVDGTGAIQVGYIPFVDQKYCLVQPVPAGPP